MIQFRENRKKTYFGPKIRHYGQKKFSEKNECRHILTFTIYQLHAKNQEISMIQFRENRKKPYFWAKNPPLWPKTGKKFFFEKSGSVTF